MQFTSQGTTLKLDKLQNRVTIDKGRFHFNNLFNGDKVLSQVSAEKIYVYLAIYSNIYIFQGWK